MTVAPPVPVSPDSRPDSDDTPVNWRVSSLSLADLEVRARDIDAARVQFELHLQQNPSDSNAWLEWAKAEDRLSADKGAAERVLSRAVACVIEDSRIWCTWARIAKKQSGIEACISVLNAGIIACPTSVEIAMARAKIETEQCGIIAARSYYKEALQIDLKRCKTYLIWASQEERSGNVTIARKLFEKALKHVQRDDIAIVYSAFASLESRLRNTEKARFLYMRAAEANPVDKIVWQAWGSLESKMGNAQRARQLFERAVVVDPSYASTWQAWGLLEMKMKNFSKAKTLFERGVKADPSESATWHAWGQLEGKLGNRVKQRELFENGILAVGNRGRAAVLHLALAGMLVDSGEIEKAREIFEKGCDRRMERPHDVARLLHAWAGMERGVGRNEVARVLYERALVERPKDVVTLCSLAGLEEEMKRYRVARNLLKRGLDVAPGDVKCAMKLAVVEWSYFASSGGVRRARAIFEKWAPRCRNDKGFLRAYAAFEAAKGDEELAQRLRTLAERIGRR